jgi:simple sugar transport system ATP-binding protein
MTLPFLRRFSRATLMRGPAERRAAGKMMSDIGVVARGPSSPIENLSGGNQQKVMIGRWLLGSPRVLLLDEPFRGVDINARHDIGATVRALTDTAAVLVATSDLDEALEVGDRIVVLNHGRPAADLPLAQASRERLIDAMSARPPTSREVAVGFAGSAGTAAEPAGAARAGKEAGP